MGNGLLELRYCGIIIVSGRPILVALVVNPYPRIYVPTNVYTIFFNIYQDHPEDATHEFRPHEQGKI